MTNDKYKNDSSDVITKIINYSGNWALDISNMSKEEWNQLVSICDAKGVQVYNKKYDAYSKYLEADGDCILRDVNTTKTKVTLLEMFNILESPPKSANQIKIEELQKTIELASKQINELQGD
jgi:hypothetical protein